MGGTTAVAGGAGRAAAAAAADMVGPGDTPDGVTIVAVGDKFGGFGEIGGVAATGGSRATGLLADVTVVAGGVAVLPATACGAGTASAAPAVKQQEQHISSSNCMHRQC